MNIKTNTRKITLTAMLTAIAILIPMVMPIKIIIGPASFTLGSHVAILIAMFLSPSIALIVSIGGAIGFFVAGFPFVIVLRALSHVFFAGIGAFILKDKQEKILSNFGRSQFFSILIAFIHALAETVIVSVFFFGGLVEDTSAGYFYTVILLVGVGTFIHSIVDFFIAQYLWKGIGYRITSMVSHSY